MPSWDHGADVTRQGAPHLTGKCVENHAQNDLPMPRRQVMECLQHRSVASGQTSLEHSQGTAPRLHGRGEARRCDAVLNQSRLVLGAQILLNPNICYGVCFLILQRYDEGAIGGAGFLSTCQSYGRQSPPSHENGMSMPRPVWIKAVSACKFVRFVLMRCLLF